MKSRPPVLSALPVLAVIIGGYVAVFIPGNFAAALIFGAKAEMNWPFSFLLILLFPFVFLGGIIAAIITYVRARKPQHGARVE